MDKGADIARIRGMAEGIRAVEMYTAWILDRAQGVARVLPEDSIYTDGVIGRAVAREIRVFNRIPLRRDELANQASYRLTQPESPECPVGAETRSYARAKAGGLGSKTPGGLIDAGRTVAPAMAERRALVQVYRVDNPDLDARDVPARKLGRGNPAPGSVTKREHARVAERVRAMQALAVAVGSQGLEARRLEEDFAKASTRRERKIARMRAMRLARTARVLK
jgi:hypothetical protein